MKLHSTDLEYDKVNCSLKHNAYIVIKTQVATGFGTSEPSSGKYFIYRHGAFNELAHYGIPYCLQTNFILKFKSTDVSRK